MREEIYRYLSEFYDVRKVEIDRDAEIHGEPAIRVSVYWLDAGIRVVSVSTFRTANGMLAVEMARVMDSYMKKGRIAEYV